VVKVFDSYNENTLTFFPERCINCRRCTEVCPHGVFQEGEEKAVLFAPERCMECGACARNCPPGAIEVQSGVGCAAALMRVALTGKGEETCGDAGCCGGDESSRM
jgi:NAD-dependent dihydropyrimidine dehydrogenase PreA subunit